MVLKKLFQAVVATTLLTGLSKAATINVYLQGGQSNADGRAELADFNAPYNAEQPNYMIIGRIGDMVQTLKPRLSGSNDCGPELSFPLQMATNYGKTMAYPGGSDDSVVIVKYAVGATSLYGNWKADGTVSTASDGGVYQDFQTHVDDALNYLETTYPDDTINVAGMYWMQGEADAKADRTTAQYEADLTNFITDIRANYGANLPFAIGCLSVLQTAADYNTPNGTLDQIVAAQQNVADNMTNVEAVNTDSFGMQGDNLHLDGDGQTSLGIAFANALDTAGSTSFVNEYVSSVVAHYSFDGDLNDSSWYQSHATGTPTGGFSGTDKVFGSAAASLANDNLTTPEISFSNTDNYTLAFWLKRADKDRKWNLVLGTHDNVCFYGIGDNEGVSFRTPGSVRTDFAAGTAPDDTEWHHYALVVSGDGVNMDLYIDGVNKGTKTPSATDFTITNIGSPYSDDNNFGVSGLLDEVWVFNTALSESKVNNLFQRNDSESSVKSLNVNFSGKDSQVASDLKAMPPSSKTAGAFATGHWISISNQTQGVNTTRDNRTLYDSSTGGSTVVTVDSVYTQGLVGNDVALDDANFNYNTSSDLSKEMMNTLAKKGATTPWTVTFNNLQHFASGYKVVVYYSCSRDYNGVNYQVTDGTYSKTVTRAALGAVSTSQTAFEEEDISDNQINSATSNYMVFGSTFSPLTGNQLTVTTSGASNAPINGIQIIQVNNPASILPPLVTLAPKANGVDLSWATVETATEYEIDISSDNFATSLSGYPKTTADTTITAGSLVAGTDYSVRVRAALTGGGYSDYCTKTFTTYNESRVVGSKTYAWDSWGLNSRFRIMNVAISGENATSIANDLTANADADFDSYLKDFTNLSADLCRDVEYTMNITLRDNNPSKYCDGQVWIDWNGNGVFDEGTNEALGIIGTGGVMSTDPEASYEVTFIVPADASLGSSMMRIRVTDSGSALDANLKADGSDGATGTAQDYTINIVPTEIEQYDTVDLGFGGATNNPTYADWSAVEAALPSKLQVSSVDVATVTWAESTYTPSVAGTYTFTGTVGSYEEGFIDDVNPISSVTTELTVLLEQPVVTAVSQVDTSVTVDHEIVLTWNAVNGATGYTPQLSLSSEMSSPIAPSSSTATSATFTGLADYTTYYYEVTATDGTNTSTATAGSLNTWDYVDTADSYISNLIVHPAVTAQSSGGWTINDDVVTTDEVWCDRTATLTSSLSTYLIGSSAIQTSATARSVSAATADPVAYFTAKQDCKVYLAVNNGIGQGFVPENFEKVFESDGLTHDIAFTSSQGFLVYAASYSAGQTVALPNQKNTARGHYIVFIRSAQENSSGVSVSVSGDLDGVVTTDLPIGPLTHRLARTWLVSNAGTLAGQTISFDLGEFGIDFSSSAGYTLLRRNPGTRAGAWEVDTSTGLTTSLTTDTITFSGVDFVDGYEYTVAADVTLTPAVGINVVQEGTTISWTIESQVGVEKYIVTDAAGNSFEVPVEQGRTEYDYTVDVEGEITLTVVDYSGYSQTFLPADGNIIKVVYDLVGGWNLIAIAGANADTDELGTLWGWNGDSYEMEEAPEAGQAVWVYSAYDVQVIVQAEKAQAELELTAGWNMVGPTVNMNVPAEAHTVYGWNDTYQTIANDGTLLQGVGYWIFCDK